MSWWVPLAFLAATIIGVAIAFSLTAGRSGVRRSADELLPHGHARRKSRYQEDNELVWNPGAFVAAAGMIGLLVLIGVLVEVL